MTVEPASEFESSIGVELQMATLYLLEQYSVVKVEGDALRVESPRPKEAERRSPAAIVRVPLTAVEHVLVFGDVTLTTPALHALFERRIPVHYLSLYGQSYGSAQADPGKNSLLRLAQVQLWQDGARRFAVARQCVRGKLVNMRAMVLRAARNRPDGTAQQLQAAAAHIAQAIQAIQRLPAPATPDPADRMHGLGALLGWEGRGSTAYYAALGAMLKDDWGFEGRFKRPPPDPVNALLSLGYVMLTKQVASLIAAVGLDVGLGVLHQPGYGKPTLALDLMEPFRPLLVDSVVLTMLNTRQIQPDDFQAEFGGVWLKDAPRKVLFKQLEARLQEQVRHPVLAQTVSYRRCIEIQVRLFAKVAQGEIATYVPFTVR